MFFKKNTEKNFEVHPKVQTAEGWKRMMTQRLKGTSAKKKA